MPENKDEMYFNRLLIEVRMSIIEMLKMDGGSVQQEKFMQQLNNLIVIKPQLAEMAKEYYEDAWLFVFGALIHLISEGIVGFDEAGMFYFLILNDPDGN